MSRFVVVASSALAIAAAFAPLVAADKKLNVLFIVSDDLNCSLGCYGDKITQSPNIDRLAARGVRFDRAYCNYPVCNASRTSFLSGRRPETTKVLGNGTPPRVALGPDFRFLPEYFHDHDYFTAGIGKIAHGTFATAVKWDVFGDVARGLSEEDDTAPARQKAKKAGGKAKKAAKAAADTAGADVPFGWQATSNEDADEPDGHTARRVAKLIEEHKEGPFFIAAGFHKPHVPHTAPKKYFEMYPAAKMPLPAEPEGHAKYIPEIARPAKYYPDLTPDQERAIIQHYHAATTFMDAQVGLLLDTLDRLKLWESTIVVFIGDHGWHLGEHDGFWAKVSLMEESARAPLIICVPGKKAGAVSPRLAEFVDLFPTLTDLCELPLPNELEGISLAPLLDDPTRPWKKAVFTVVSRRGGLGRAVRTETHTLLVWPDGSEQLYDVARDPHEYDNLAADTRMKQTADALRQLLSAGWQAALPR
jgi:iduronate 2-sulfatase